MFSRFILEFPVFPDVEASDISKCLREVADHYERDGTASNGFICNDAPYGAVVDIIAS